MSNPQQPATTHRQLTGIVTKLVGDGALYGFINDEIFFPQTNVVGGPASVGDQVFAECEYSAHLPIKWNATSIKIVSKSGGQQHQVNSNDPRQQEMIQGQQQPPPPPFGQASPVAVTYQQHRQQRQQRQMMDVKQPNNNMPPAQPNSELTTRLLDQAHGTGGEYFASGNSRPFPQPQPQQAETSIQPFQEQPMGPNFTYTSQLGSAFVQNQFVPAPFMAQPPPTMLPQQPQQPPPPQQRQQQLITPNINQMHNQQNNQRQNQHNKQIGNRFNNQDKNDRQYNNNNFNNNNNRRNQNRNDNKFDRPRSGDRDAPLGNNRASNKRNDSRDRSLNKTKRDDVPVRPSPPPQSSAQSTTSVGSDKGVKNSRRQYKTQNLPKVKIMTNMNSYNMKQRCPSSVHVPSDLKEIIVNRHFRLDIKNTPKPIKYTIDRIKKEVSTQQAETSKVVKADVTERPIDSEDLSAAIAAEAKAENEVINQCSDVSGETKDVEKINEQKSIQLPTPPTSKSDLKLNHKYGVKVILIALPELDNIYKNVFGPNLDSFNLDSKSGSSLDDSISLLCNKGSNNGYSFIGGRFDPVLDGFIEDATNEFERHGRQPDLIATCKRVVLEQAGLDLGPCKGWNLLSTFIYNNKSDYYSSKASIEYSYIYMPQIWTMLSENLDKNASFEKQPSPLEAIIADQKSSDEPSESNTTDYQEPEAISLPTPSESAPESNIEPADTPGETQNDDPPLCPENLSELKVTELKVELDKRNISYKAGIKKAELIALLQNSLNNLQTDVEDGTVEQETPETASIAIKQDDVLSTGVVDSDVIDADLKTEGTQLEEGEVEADGSTNDSPSETHTSKAEGEAPLRDSEQLTGKRKIEEPDEPNNKKVCTESPMKDKRVELIRESFKVYTRDEQQQLVLVSLNEVSLASRHDQFELSVASNILKESLAQHLSEYMLTTLVEDHKQRTALSSNAGTSTSSSQEAGSDTNNNSAGKDTFKNPITPPSEHKVNLKELPVDRYINLAFSFFDASHTGYLYFEDLNKLFNNTGLSISKRALVALVGDGEKFNYRTLPDLSPKLPPTYLYQFPAQFNCLPGTSTSSNSNLAMFGKMVEYKGVTYDVEKLIQQVKDAETLSVSLVDRFNYAIENSDKQAEEIHVLEVSQKSLAKAIKAQNDEICDLKRERDSIKKKCDNLRKGIKGTVTSLTDLMKDEKQ